ncbi:MAG: hypothetical protein ACI3X7_03900, partial [Bacteroidaceae bacterium]
ARYAFAIMYVSCLPLLPLRAVEPSALPQSRLGIAQASLASALAAPSVALRASSSLQGIAKACFASALASFVGWAG